MKTTQRLIACAAVLALFMCANAVNAQTYKPDWATKLVLPSAGTDPSKLFTITSGTLSGALSWTLPITAGSSGYMLTTDGTGVLSWTNPSVTLGGDVTGASGSNTINNTVQAGNDIVAALNAPATAKSLNADVLNYDATLGVTSHVLGIALAHANTWTGDQTLPADATQAAALVSSINASTSAKSLNADVLDYGSTLKVGSHVLDIDLTHANAWTAAQTFNQAGIAATYTTGAFLANTTASTSGVPVQQSASLEFDSHVWNTTATAVDNTFNARQTFVPVSGLTPSALMNWDVNNNGGGWTNVMSLSSAGVLTATTFAGNATTATTAANLSGSNLTGDVSNVANAVHVNSVQTGAGASIVTAINTASGNGQIDAVNGGTGQSTYATGDILYASSSSALSRLAVGGANTVLHGGTTPGYSNIATGDIASGAVTYAKIQNVAASSLLGNPTGSPAAPSEITLGTGLGFSSTTLTNTGVTSNLAGAGITVSGATGAVTVSLDLTHANTWTGTQTFGAAALTASSPTALSSGTTNDWALSTSNSYFLISASGAATLTGVVARAGGSVIMLVNTGSNAITLANATGSSAANQFHLQGASNVILAQDGTVTLIYDGTSSYWRMIAAQ